MPISDDKSTREAKLAEALRTNLRKRKAAARGSSGGDLDPATAVAEAAPKPYQAVRSLLGITHRDASRVDLAVEMSVPFPNPDGEGWAVAVRLTGDGGQFDTEHGKAAFGRDVLAATRKALDLAQVALDLAGVTHDLRWPQDESPYDLSAPL